MSSYRKGPVRKAALAASATLLAIALPSSVFAIGMLGGDLDGSGLSLISFTPASADPDLAELIAERSGGQTQMMRFTPAGAATSRTERSVTVAVRVDQQIAQAMAARSAGAQGDNARGALRVTPVRYNLGLARGYGSFAQAPAQLAAASPALSRSLSDANIPDLADFTPRAGAREEPSRFAARVQLEEGRSARRTAETHETLSDQMLDVGGSYRLTNNLDITAGVRYEQDRDIVPLPDVDQQDSQAVYIGTQFRF